MSSKYHYLFGALMTAASLAATVALYPQLPAEIVSHWNVAGEPNGYSPKWALFLIGPGMMAATMLMTWLLPWLSPSRFDVRSFQPTYFQVMSILVAILAYLDALVLWSALGHSLNVARAGLFGVCLFFALLGNITGKIRRNFYIGVRTPWALANERVWNATHRLAAKTFVLGGLAGLAMIAAGLNGWPPFAALLAGALTPVPYSLYLYKQLERRGEL